MLSSHAAAACTGCYDDPSAFFPTATILQFQKASDLLISLAYFSIPLELFYFVTCSSIFPFRWLLLQFGSFIVLCGLTHLTAAFTYAPHSFLLLLAHTVFKILTALVSVVTSITLFTLIPQLLRLFVREGLLLRKTKELRREVGLRKMREEKSWHVRMLTAEIRRTLDRHTILDTTLVELSKVLFLHHCSIWMPAADGSDKLVLTHQMTRGDLVRPARRRRHHHYCGRANEISIDDFDVSVVIRSRGVVLLEKDSVLMGSGVEEVRDEEVGEGVAIRMPLLRAANFSSGTAEVREEASAILVLVLPADSGREWTAEEVEIVEAVADQVAVALSHAAIIEDSVAVREQLMERNSMLKKEREKAEKANEARTLFRATLVREISRPLRTVAACLSALDSKNLSAEQRAIVKGGLALSSTIQDVTNISPLELRVRHFELRPMLEDVAKVSSLLCALHGTLFKCRALAGVPDRVVGDQRRVFQAVLCMVGEALVSESGSGLALCVSVDGISEASGGWKKDLGEECVRLRIRVGRVDCINEKGLDNSVTVDMVEDHGQRMNLKICRKLAESMNGSLLVTSASHCQPEDLNLLVKLQQARNSNGGAAHRPLKYIDQDTAFFLLKGMRILLIDSDMINLTISRSVLESAGCELTVASSWHLCLEALFLQSNHFHLLLVDMRVLEEDGKDISGRVRRLRSETWLLIIALLGDSEKHKQELCQEVGIHGVIRKPIILQEMVDEIQRVTPRLQAAPALL